MAKYTIETDDLEQAVDLIYLHNMYSLPKDDYYQDGHLGAVNWLLHQIMEHGIDYGISESINGKWRQMKLRCVEIVRMIDEYHEWLEKPEP